MSNSYVTPASIEASKGSAKTRKVIPQRPIYNKKLSCQVFPFKFNRNCSISIKKELVPKKAKINKLSMLNQNDKLIGDMIYGFSKVPVPSPMIKKGSSTHKANFIEIKKFVFAKLEKSFQAIEMMTNKSISHS